MIKIDDHQDIFKISNEELYKRSWQVEARMRKDQTKTCQRIVSEKCPDNTLWRNSNCWWTCSSSQTLYECFYSIKEIKRNGSVCIWKKERLGFNNWLHRHLQCYNLNNNFLIDYSFFIKLQLNVTLCIDNFINIL